LEKKTELNAEILKFKEESDAIDAKRVKLEKDIEKNKKLKEEAVLQASINKSEKDLIEVQRNELEELKKYYGDILKN
jgi:seryl-tRNA synthetase